MVRVGIINSPPVNVSVSSSSASVDVTGTALVVGDSPTYDGIYEVTPKAKTETVLSTAGKLLKSDVTVKKIPAFETANTAGGKTLYIASDTEMELI